MKMEYRRKADQETMRGVWCKKWIGEKREEKLAREIRTKAWSKQRCGDDEVVEKWQK